MTTQPSNTTQRRVNKFLTKINSSNPEYVITTQQKEEILKVFLFLEKDRDRTIKQGNTERVLVKMVLSGVKKHFIRRLIKGKKCGKAVTKKKMLILYSRKGYEFWDEYRRKQAETNTFEYKQKKYGMTKEEFQKFNKSRAVTKELLVQRHGQEDGSKKWDEYCQRQKYTKSKQYFIDRYGKAGEDKFKQINAKKALTLPNFISKYGESEGPIKFKAAMSAAYVFYSKPSQELFKTIDNLLLQIFNAESSYYAEKNHEFSKWSFEQNRIFFYDYVIPSAKFCIEYNGDIYHANPKTYNPSCVPKFRGNTKTAKELWDNDRSKVSLLTDQGFTVLTIWDSDYNVDKQAVIDKVLEYAKTIKHNQ